MASNNWPGGIVYPKQANPDFITVDKSAYANDNVLDIFDMYAIGFPTSYAITYLTRLGCESHFRTISRKLNILDTLLWSDIRYTAAFSA